jgi:hypothetical protein
MCQFLQIAVSAARVETQVIDEVVFAFDFQVPFYLFSQLGAIQK